MEHVQKRLFYSSNNAIWQPIPAWSRFLLELGILLAKEQNNSNRVVIGIALPTRAYAACFIALGIISQRTIMNASSEETLKYYQKILTLPIGTTVIYNSPSNKTYKARYEGHTVMDNTQCIRITTQKNLSKIVKPQDVFRISFSSNTLTDLPSYQKGHSLLPNNEDFLDKFFKEWGGTFPSSYFLNSSKMECIILGNKALLRAEVEELVLGVPKETQTENTSEFFKGYLQDIIRVRSFSSLNTNYHSDVIALNSNHVKRQRTNQVPFVTIFDGASAYLKWRDYWTTSHTVILLDRTHNQFKDAVNQLNEDFINHRTEEEWNIPIQNSLTNIEIITFKENI